MTWLRFIWTVLAAFLGFAVIVTIVALALHPGDGANTTLGWIILGFETAAFSTVLLTLQARWFTAPPSSVPGAVLTGVFLRLAIAETVFLTAFVLLYADLVTRPMLVFALVVSIVLAWLFAAPTRSRIESLQNQMERLGGLYDVAAELSSLRPTERPLR